MPRSSCSLFSISESLAATNKPHISVDFPLSNVLYNWHRTMRDLFCQFLLTLYFHGSFILKQIFVVCFMAKWYFIIFHLKYLKILFILCVNVFLSACMSVYRVGVSSPRPEDSIESPVSHCVDVYLSPLQDHLACLTPELFLQALKRSA